MSDATHTPGSWTASDARGDHLIGPNVVWEVEDAHGLRLATVHTMGIGVDTGKANAVLMAAAPDMLAMLRRACELLADEDCGRYGNEGPVWDFLADADAIIAKATGDGV